MASISFDGQSFLIDGRRVWLVSGAIHYPRVPRGLWRQRIRAAKQAGLNCVETYAFWNLHEPRPGVFDFEDELDIAQFIRTIGSEGLYCILRPGPYVCAEWDLGGLPPWLLSIEGMKLREANGPFLEATARWIGALMEQVRDLQLTKMAGSVAVTGTHGGPILMIQAENEYFCTNPQQTTAYLGEVTRYLRENGCTVPINDCNNLWARVEGTISCWNGRQDMPEMLRQLRVVQPHAPRLVTAYWPGWFDHWGGPHHRGVSARDHLAHLAGILAVGGQYNQYMFHGGTNFGFWAGRNVGPPINYITTSYDYDAPLSEAGGRGEKYFTTKRVSTFASQFAHVFANLQPESQHAALVPDHAAGPPTVLHQRGAQGDVIFIFAGKPGATREFSVLLPNGLKLPVTLGDDPVAWLLLDANLAGAAKLNYSNLQPWALLDKRLLVLFGQAGTQGVVCVNDAVLQVVVPTGRAPLVTPHEKLTVVVLNTGQLDAAYPHPEGLVVGAAGLDDDDRPISLPGWRTVLIQLDGRTRSLDVKPAPQPDRKPKLSDWGSADVSDFVTGEAKDFAPIVGPESFEKLGNHFGYGWYRVELDKPVSADVLLPGAGDRLHLYRQGKLTAIAGFCPGATVKPVRLTVDRLVILADNLGRACHGWLQHQPRGVYDHLYAVKRLSLAKPRVIDCDPPDFFQFAGFVPLQRVGQHTPSQALVWKFRGSKSNDLIVTFDGLEHRGVVRFNNRAVGAYLGGASCSFTHLVIPASKVKTGVNELRLEVAGLVTPNRNIAQQVRVYRATNLTARARWAFAPWRVPKSDRFQPLSPSASGGPRWFRCSFTVTGADTPLWLEPSGMSKGQIYLNGRNVGRYFVATHTGAKVPPQSRYYLPEPWLHTDKPNELALFDEHGKHPRKCRLVYDR